MTTDTLEANLRNQLSPLWTLITFLEEKEPDEVWERAFRLRALETLPKIQELLTTWEYKKENK